MQTRQAYEELGLDPNATDAQLKASWRRLVAAWHPDRNAAADALARMQAINKAYQHIRQLRDGGDPDDESETQADEKPAAQMRKVRLNLEDTILGCTRTLRGHFTHSCADCAGQGQRVLAQACSHCQGRGILRTPALFGWLWNESPCPDCEGDGQQREHCSACDGHGEVSVNYRRRVRFPPGLRAGAVLSVPGSGHGASAIDLELEIEIEPHPLFSIDEQGLLRCEMPVSGYAWMANRWVEVPTPDGLQQMRLNRDALVYRLSGQGLPQGVRGARGDYLIKVVPEFGGDEDAAQAELLDQWIAAAQTRAEADPQQPMGRWARQLRRWKTQHKERSQDS